MKKSLLANLLDMIHQYRLRLFGAFIMVLIGNGLLVFNPLVLRQALIAMDPKQPLETSRLTIFFHELFGPYFHSIYPWAIFLILTAIVSALLKYYMRMIFVTISRKVELEVREQLYQRIESQSKAFFDRHGIGDLLSRLTNDITAYRDVLGFGLMYPLFFITLVVPSMIILFMISTPLACLSLLPILVIFILNFLIRKPLYKVSQEAQKSLSDMSVMTHEHYSGIRVIKSYGIEQAAFHLFKDLCQIFSRINMRFATLQGMIIPVLTLITKITTVLLVLLAGAIILKGWGTLTLADFLSFMWIQSYIFGPLLMLGWVLPMYQRGRAAYARIVEIVDEPIEVYEEPNAAKHIPQPADLVFKHLTFTYPLQNRPALLDIHLEVENGMFIGITGPVGAGKTTLLRLLNREYEIPKGKIFIAGRDIHEYSLQAFHAEMVTVEQVPFLFSKTIGENVRFGKREATQEELESVSRQADLHETILDFPKQYDTIVGERGVSLSGGQKQRVAIARAFLVNRSILLLDDIFSALDFATEKRIFEAMKKNFKGKTLILVTHRVSILEQMDRVIYMKEGRIIENDSPEELVKQKGPYGALVDLQKIQVL